MVTTTEPKQSRKRRQAHVIFDALLDEAERAGNFGEFRLIGTVQNGNIRHIRTSYEKDHKLDD